MVGRLDQQARERRSDEPRAAGDQETLRRPPYAALHHRYVFPVRRLVLANEFAAAQDALVAPQAGSRGAEKKRYC